MTSPAPETLRADVVVIGSGAGGAPVAAVLAEAGLEVLVLEQGPRLSSADFSGDEQEMTSRLYTMALTEGSGLSLYAGSCAGGSTVINDALCWRTPPEILEAWRTRHGLRDLEAEAFAPYVERAWSDVHAEATGRAHLNRNAHRLELGAGRLGWAAEAMPRSVNGCVNLGLCNFGCPSNAKQSTLLAYLPRAEHAGARLLADTRVDRIRVEAGAVRGVECTRLDPGTRRPRARLRVDAPRVCLAAGVLGSPPLLLRSGLPGRSASAGRGIQFHTSLHVTARFAEPVHGYYGPTMAWAVTEFSDVHGGRGPGFMIENTAVHPVATASALPGFGAEHERGMAALPHLARALVVLRDRTRGRITLGRRGAARVRYTLLPADLERLRVGMLATARAYFAAGALEVLLPVNGLGALRDEAGLAELRGLRLEPGAASLLYAVHLFGGAAMDGAAARGFCDPEGASWDVRGLHVSDASALPSNTGVNPQITVMANALRVADAMLAAGRRAA